MNLSISFMSKEFKKHKYKLEQAVMISPEVILHGMAGVHRIGIIKKITIKEITKISSEGETKESFIKYSVLIDPENCGSYDERYLSPIKRKHKLTWKAKKGNIIIKDREKYEVIDARLIGGGIHYDHGDRYGSEEFSAWQIRAKKFKEDGVANSDEVCFNQEEPYEVLGS
jgi:hypothetical protein